MSSFWKIIKEVIEDADVLILLLDARFLAPTRNAQVEEMVKQAGKPLIYVITKCDLVPKNTLDHYKQQLHPCVFVSATKHHGVNLLKERIMIEGKKAKKDEGEIKVGVLGYPNTGKSSLINAMTGTTSASVSNQSGWTRSMKKIRASKGLVFIDTPGVIPTSDKDLIAQGARGTIDFSKTKDPDLVVAKLITEYPGVIEAHYGVGLHDDPEDTVEQIAIDMNLIVSGGKPDLPRAYKMILKDWQTGKIKPFRDATR